MERALHAGDEVTITWRAEREGEWTARGRIEQIDERYILLHDRTGGLILIPCFAIRAIDNHGYLR